MTALYGYKDKVTGKRVIALALRNKDAILLGMGGPESGDILYWMAEGYNYDHCDSLSTTYGYGGTSVSPIFIAAGTGLKKGYETTRIIREVDLTPTMAVLAAYVCLMSVKALLSIKYWNKLQMISGQVIRCSARFCSLTALFALKEVGSHDR